MSILSLETSICVAILHVENNETLASLVSESIGKAPGAVRTETLIAFRVFSKRELESMFNLD
jgi:hypothetical protein